jgi:WD40 repeat protein
MILHHIFYSNQLTNVNKIFLNFSKYLFQKDSNSSSIQSGSTVLTGELVKTISTNFSILCIATLHDDTLAISGKLGSIQIWRLVDTPDAKLLKTLEGHKTWVRCLKALPLNDDTAGLASACEFGEIIIWNSRTGELVRRLNGHKEEIRCMEVLNDGVWLASGSTDKTLKIWNTQNGEILKSIHMKGYIYSMAVYNNQQFLAVLVDHCKIKLVNAKSGMLLGIVDCDDISFVVSLVGMGPNLLAMAGLYDSNIIIQSLDQQAGGVLRYLKKEINDEIEISTRVSSMISFTENGSLLASGYNDGIVRVWNTSSGDLLKTFRFSATFNNDRRVQAMELLSDSCLVCASLEGDIQIWR